MATAVATQLPPRDRGRGRDADAEVREEAHGVVRRHPLLGAADVTPLPAAAVGGGDEGRDDPLVRPDDDGHHRDPVRDGVAHPSPAQAEEAPHRQGHEHVADDLEPDRPERPVQRHREERDPVEPGREGDAGEQPDEPVRGVGHQGERDERAHRQARVEAGQDPRDPAPRVVPDRRERPVGEVRTPERRAQEHPREHEEDADAERSLHHDQPHVVHPGVRLRGQALEQVRPHDPEGGERAQAVGAGDPGGTGVGGTRAGRATSSVPTDTVRRGRGSSVRGGVVRREQGGGSRRSVRHGRTLADPDRHGGGFRAMTSAQARPRRRIRRAAPGRTGCRAGRPAPSPRTRAGRRGAAPCRSRPTRPRT